MNATLRLFKSLALLTLIISGCENIDQVKPDDRNSFLHYYGGPANFIAKAAEPLSDGYLIVGDSVGVEGYGIVLIKADPTGKTLWRRTISGGVSSALKIVSEGYLIIGDSIKVDPQAEQVNDQIKRKMRLLKIDGNGNILSDKSFGSFDTLLPRVDHRGYAITINSTGTVIATGTVRYQGQRAKTNISAHDPNSFDMLWSKTYDLDNRDYINAKSAHLTQAGEIIWATSATLELTNSNRSYLAIPVLKPNSTFDNNLVFGRNEDLYHSGEDIQPNALGYGVIGTYKSITGTNANLFFLRTDINGNIVSGSERYFDGETLGAFNKALDDKTFSASEDEGTALASTDDGGFLLAGSMTSTIARGTGGKDILIIRVDAFGNILWNNLIGGSGDETVSTVRATQDGGFLICGTLDLAGLSSIYILKTNAYGQLID